MTNSSRTECFKVEKSLPGERLDTLLRSRFPVVSRGSFRRLIESGHVKVNGQTVKPPHHARVGDTIEVSFPEAGPASAQPEDIPLEILFEDDDLLVLNKPPGLVVHPSAGHEEHTLVNALLHHCAGKLSGIGGVARPGIVHRLDKDTSGCLVVAKNDSTHVALSGQFAERTAAKTYLAIVCGDVPRDSGEIRAAIARHPSHRKRMAVTEGTGREARTSFRVLERLQGSSLLEAILHTGRTHQIRVHFQHLGFPVAGDETYGAKQSRRLAELTGYAPTRCLLHAYSLAFTHPRTGTQLRLVAPTPADFRAAVVALRRAP